jgi:hypothetical protein
MGSVNQQRTGAGHEHKLVSVGSVHLSNMATGASKYSRGDFRGINSSNQVAKVLHIFIAKADVDESCDGMVRLHLLVGLKTAGY